MRVRVNWSVAEDHSAVVRVGDDEEVTAELLEHLVPEVEDSKSYVCTSDRVVVDWEVLDDDE